MAFNCIIGQSLTSVPAKFHSSSATPRPVCTRPARFRVLAHPLPDESLTSGHRRLLNQFST